MPTITSTNWILITEATPALELVDSIPNRLPPLSGWHSFTFNGGRLRVLADRHIVEEIGYVIDRCRVQSGGDPKSLILGKMDYLTLCATAFDGQLVDEYDGVPIVPLPGVNRHIEAVAKFLSVCSTRAGPYRSR
jgi:hypothetical protein